LRDTTAEYLGYYRRMVRIRRFEDALARLFSEGLTRGTCHLCIGQEAVAVGACAGLAEDDLVTSNHRGHGHLLAKGGDPGRVMAELLGKSTGYAAGRGGTQHMSCPEIGFLGSNGITAGGILTATGAAFAQQRNRTGRVVLCFFGDGATEQGAFHEGLNMGALWRLPVVYLCENNGYAMSTPFHRHCAGPSVAARAAAYGMPGRVVDGHDVLAVREAVADAARRARAGDGPSLVECRTYRWRGHSKSDRCEYRTRLEEQAAMAHDCVARFRAWLAAKGHASADELTRLDDAASADIADAVEFARASPDATEDAVVGVYA